MSTTTSRDFNDRSAAAVDDLALNLTPPPVLPIDKYLGELRDCGLSEEQANEFLATLVPLIWHFVDLGFRGDISELLLSGKDSGTLNSESPLEIELGAKAGKESVKT